MSDTVQVTRREWVERVLGVRIDSGATTSLPGDFKKQWQQSFETFRDATETVDMQMAALAGACRQSKDPWLMRIADLGLSAVTGNFKTPLMAACLDVSGASGDNVAGAVAKARNAVADFAQHIATDPQVVGCDSNPFGVSVSIRATLGPALKSLNDALRHAP